MRAGVSRYLTVLLSASLSLALVVSLGCTKGGGTRGGQSFSARIEAAKSEPDAEVRAAQLAAIGVEQSGASEPYEAKQTLKLAVQAAAKIERPVQRARMLAQVAKDQVKVNDRLDAQRTLKLALDAVEEVEGAEDQAGILADTAIAQAGIGAPKDAEQTLKRALELAQSVDQPQDRMIVLSRVGGAQAQIEQESEARTTLLAAGALAESIDDLQIRGQRLAVLAASWRRFDTEKSDEIFAEAVSAVESIENPVPRAYGFIQVGTQMHQAGIAGKARGMFDRANNTAREVTSAAEQRAIFDEVERTQKALRG